MILCDSVNVTESWELGEPNYQPKTNYKKPESNEPEDELSKKQTTGTNPVAGLTVPLTLAPLTPPLVHILLSALFARVLALAMNVLWSDIVVHLRERENRPRTVGAVSTVAGAGDQDLIMSCSPFLFHRHFTLTSNSPFSRSNIV